MPVVSFPRRLADLAAAQPDRPAVTCGDRSISRAGLAAWSDRLARDLQGRGVGQGDMVTIALPNSLEWFVAFVAAWKLGAIPQPVSSRLPARELGAIVALAGPKVVVGALDGVGDEVGGASVVEAAAVRALVDSAPPAEDAEPLPDVVSPAWKAPTSGGSTGRPKLIVSGDPAEIDSDAPPLLRLAPDGCLVMPGPLYHNGPIVWSMTALLAGSHVVVLERFDAAETLRAIADHGADTVYLVPTMMKRISRLPDEVRLGFDLSSLRTVWHLAEPCPPWLKQQWIDWFGPDVILELYAGTEAQTATIITGHDWLAHQGSVGRPAEGAVAVLDPDGQPVPAGTVGEVWLRRQRDRPTYRYVGAEARTRDGGWESLGDLGYLDDDGFLYLADRAQDMIVSGGANLYPAEIEAALNEHPAVRSCAVVGLPDDDLGHRAHAIVETDTLAIEDLRAFVRERLAAYKVPRTWEVVQASLRDDAGKVRRSELRAARLPGPVT
ncbi:MAG TPA: AMP-binding protein [Acidimicrobiales bacterium]|jgi:bile acid-coenzyme A ligase|nr:AMP-binding protein [Acidimicrobiales bacterium]